MPLADSTIAIYNQPGFVPDSLMQQWAESEFTIGPIVEWLGIDEPTASAVSTLVGYTNSTHVSGISGIPIDEWEDMLRDPGLGIRLTMGVKAQVRHLMTACRHIMGLNVPAQPGTTIINQASPSTALAAPPVIDDLLTVKVGDIARQGNESKVQLCSWEVVDEGRKRYFKSEGDDPPYAEQPTHAQITIFLALLTKLASIFVDFAIFVPYGDRALQDRLFDAMAFSGAGLLTKMRLHGPPSYTEWLACYKIFWALCIMYNVIDNGPLKRYAEKIYKFTVDYPGSWGVDLPRRRAHTPRTCATSVGQGPGESCRSLGQELAHFF